MIVPGFSHPQLPHEVTVGDRLSNSIFFALIFQFTSNKASGLFVLIPTHHLSGLLPQGTLIINVHVFIDVKSAPLSLFHTNELLLFAFALTHTAKL